MFGLVPPTAVVFKTRCVARYIRVTVPPQRRIEDRIRQEFHTLVDELRFAIFTLKWQIRTGLKNFPPELDRRVRRLKGDLF